MKQRNINTRIAVCASLSALAVIFSYIEYLIPISIGVPGIKLGIANLVVITGLYLLPPGQVFLINLVRILIMGAFFGSGMSILYSLAGGIFSFAIMVLLKRIPGFSMIGVSIAGGTAHNAAQIAVAALVLQNAALFSYLPVLIFAGVLCGLVIGVVGGQCIRALRSAGRVYGLFDTDKK